jgi:hypothetical protein
LERHRSSAGEEAFLASFLSHHGRRWHGNSLHRVGWRIMTIHELLGYYELGIMTRSELVSALAERSYVKLDDEALQHDVDALREKIAEGVTFVIKSTC